MWQERSKNRDREKIQEEYTTKPEPQGSSSQVKIYNIDGQEYLYDPNTERVTGPNDFSIMTVNSDSIKYQIEIGLKAREEWEKEKERKRQEEERKRQEEKELRSQIIRQLFTIRFTNLPEEQVKEKLVVYENLCTKEAELLEYIQILEERKAYHGPLEYPINVEMELRAYTKQLNKLQDELSLLEEQLQGERDAFSEVKQVSMSEVEKKVRQTRINHLESQIEHKRKLMTIYQRNIQLLEVHMANNVGNLSLKVPNEYALIKLEIEQTEHDLQEVQKQIEVIEAPFYFYRIVRSPFAIEYDEDEFE